MGVATAPRRRRAPPSPRTRTTWPRRAWGRSPWARRPRGPARRASPRARGKAFSPRDGLLAGEALQLLADDRLRELRDHFPHDALDHLPRQPRDRFDLR